jgi:hypothetical protein
LEKKMKILRGFTYCMRTMLLGLCVAALSQIAAAQIWIASTGSVDESSISTYQFVGQLAFVRPSLATGTVTLRYNVLPTGDLLKPINPCCEFRTLDVRFLDNGSGAQVIVTLKQYNVGTGQLTTLLTFDSNDFPPQSAFQEGFPLLFGSVLNFSFAELGGCCAYYVEAKLIRSAPGGTPGLGAIMIETKSTG